MLNVLLNFKICLLTFNEINQTLTVDRHFEPDGGGIAPIFFQKSIREEHIVLHVCVFRIPYLLIGSSAW